MPPVSLARLYFGLVFLFCVCLLGFGLYLEHYKGLEPCPLCIFQRIAYIGITIIALVAMLHGPGPVFARIYNTLIALAALCGGGIAVRQVWLQHLPAEQVPECGAGLDYMLEVFPLGEALKMILSGSGECAEVQWTLLGFSIAEWSVGCFLFLTIISLLLIFQLKRIS